MRKQIYISLIAIFCFLCAQAQQKKYVYEDTALTKGGEIPEPGTVTSADTAVYETQVFSDKGTPRDTVLYLNDLAVSPDSVAAWRNGKGFEYIQYLDSMLKARKQVQKKEEHKTTDNTDYQPPPPSGSSWLSRLLASSVTQAILWALAIAFVLFILYKLFLGEGAFRKNTTKNTANEPEVSEEIITPESDFDRMIRLAVSGGNYRLAVRYQYLKTLHALAERQHVTLAADKTNYNYVQEIRNEQLRNDFAALTLNYEYIWYGEFTINDDIYNKLAPAFSVFNNKV